MDFALLRTTPHAMTLLRLLPAILSLLILAAHFLRRDSLLFVGLVFLCLALLFVRQRWAVRLIQIVLTVGFFEWLFTLTGLLVDRLDAGEPWLRMTLILGGVALLTLVSALLFQAKALRRVYRMDGIGRGKADEESSDTN